MLKQDFPISIEDQLLGGDATGDRPTCNVCTPGTNIVMNGKLWTDHCTESSSKTYRKGEEWVRAETLVLGDSVIKTYCQMAIRCSLITNHRSAAGGKIIMIRVKIDGQLLSSGLFRCKVKVTRSNSEKWRLWTSLNII